MGLESRRRRRATRKKPPAVRRLKSKHPDEPEFHERSKQVLEEDGDWTASATARCEARCATVWNNSLTSATGAERRMEPAHDWLSTKNVMTGAATISTSAGHRSRSERKRGERNAMRSGCEGRDGRALPQKMKQRRAQRAQNVWSEPAGQRRSSEFPFVFVEQTAEFLNFVLGAAAAGQGVQHQLFRGAIENALQHVAAN